MPDAAPLPAAAVFWQSHGLRAVTANALAREGICSFNELSAYNAEALYRIYSIGNKGVAEIQQMLLQRAAGDADAAPSLARYADAALVMELLRRGYRIDRPDANA